MLNDDEKTRIRQEEIFRSEIRREIEASKPQQPLRARLWTWLNSSSLALWFLSSVVLTGLTAFFTYQQSKRSEANQNVEIERRIATEISHRINEALEGLRHDEVDIKNEVLYPPGDYYWKAVKYLDNSFLSDKNDPQDFSFYREYRETKFLPLVDELMHHEKHATQVRLRQAVDGYNRLDALSSRDQLPPIKPLPPEAPAEQSRRAVATASGILVKEQNTFLWLSAFPKPVSF